MKWVKLPFGFVIENNKLRRTSWALKIGVKNYCIRFVEWPWSGFQIQLYSGSRYWSLIRQYRKPSKYRQYSSPHLKKWYVKHD